MKTLFLLFSLALAAIVSPAQIPEDPLASFTGGTITARHLSAADQEAIARMPALLADARKQMLAQKLGSILLEKEAAALKTTIPALIKSQTAKIKDPTEAQIQAVYDANKAEIGGRPISE